MSRRKLFRTFRPDGATTGGGTPAPGKGGGSGGGRGGSGRGGGGGRGGIDVPGGPSGGPSGGPNHGFLGDTTYVTGSGQFIAFPVGTVAGDLAILHHTTGWSAVSPSGWATHSSLQSGLANGVICSKILTSADITAGGVTITQSGGSYPGVANMTIVPGRTDYASTQNASQSGNIVAAASNSQVEQIIGDLDVTLGSFGSAIAITVLVTWSMLQANGFSKQVTLRLRRDNLAGAVIASNTQFATLDSAAGADRTWSQEVFDEAPTTGRYVVTAQTVSSQTGDINSATHQLKLETHRPVIREVAAAQANSGYTSLVVSTAGAGKVGDRAVYMLYQRDVNTTVTCSRGTLVDRVGGANASGGLWEETLAAQGVVSATFGAGAAGNSYMHGIALVHPGT